MEAVSILRFGLRSFVLHILSSARRWLGVGTFMVPQWICLSHGGVKRRKKGGEQAGGLKWKCTPKCAGIGVAGFPSKASGTAPALCRSVVGLGHFAGQVEPVAAVPALAVFQETCPSSSQGL